MTAADTTMETPSAAAQKQASGSSFYLGMRVLPKAERDAMFNIYAFCRAVDDIADEPMGSSAARREALDSWRRDLDSLYAGGPPGRAAFLAQAVARFGLEKADLLTVIDGMQMDVDAQIRGPSLDELDLYCDRVASAVGRLSVRVFAMEDGPGRKLAHHLGRALQLTNILRDLDEDASIGRLYLPAELLQAVRIESRDPPAVVADPRIDHVCRALASLAHEHYREADLVFASKPRGKLAAPRLMRVAYGTLLEESERQGWAAPRKRAKLSKPRLVWLLLTSGLSA